MNIDEIVARLLSNECLILPSDTLYGVAARAYSKHAVEKVFALKNRPMHKKLPVHYASVEQLKQDIELDESNQIIFEKLAQKFWPGKLTIVAKIRSDSKLQCLEGSVAVRIPGSVLLQQVITKLGEPITMPSANLHQEAPIDDFDEISKNLQLNGVRGQVSDVASTIVDITNGLKFIRVGAISEAEILNALSPVSN